MKNNIERTIKITSLIFGIITAVDFIYGMFYYKSFIASGLSKMEISFLMSMGSICLLVFDFPSGNISDAIGRKKSVGIGVILWGIGLYLFSISNSFLYFAISIIVFNLGVALESGSLGAWLHTYLVKKDKVDLWDEAVACMTFNQNFVKFFLNGVFLILASTIHLNLLSVSGIVLIILGFFTLFWNKKEENYGAKKTLGNAIIDNIKYVFKDSKIKKLATIKLFSSIFLTSFLLIFPYRFTEIFHLDKELLPYTYFGLNFVMFLSSYLYKKILYKRFEINDIYITNIVVGAISLLLILFANNMYVFFAGITIFELFFVINLITFGTFQYDYISDENKSAMLSVLSSIGSLSSSILFLVVGFFLEHQSYVGGLGGLIILLSIGIIITKKRLQSDKISCELTNE